MVCYSSDIVFGWKLKNFRAKVITSAERKIPEQPKRDNETQSTSFTFKVLDAKYKFTITMSFPYNPKGQSLIESHREMMKRHLIKCQKNKD